MVSEMIKVVINRCHGGFGLSKKAVIRYCNQTGINPGEWNDRIKMFDEFIEHELSRSDPTLVKIVEEMGEDANGSYAELAVVEIPDDVNWYIEEYDGREWVAERHRTWS